MTAKIVRFPDVGRPVRRDITEGALIIILPIVRVERHAEPPPKPRVRRKARSKPAA